MKKRKTKINLKKLLINSELFFFWISSMRLWIPLLALMPSFLLLSSHDDFQSLHFSIILLSFSQKFGNCSLSYLFFLFSFFIHFFVCLNPSFQDLDLIICIGLSELQVSSLFLGLFSAFSLDLTVFMNCLHWLVSRRFPVLLQPVASSFIVWIFRALS